MNGERYQQAWSQISRYELIAEIALGLRVVGTEFQRGFKMRHRLVRATFLGQDVNARERMANEFARALVSAILEAF